MHRTYLSEIEPFYDRATLRRWLRELLFFCLRSPSPYAQDSEYSVDLLAEVRAPAASDAERVERAVDEARKDDWDRARAAGLSRGCPVTLRPEADLVTVRLSGRHSPHLADETTVELARAIEHALVVRGLAFVDVGARGPLVSAVTCPELADVAPPLMGAPCTSHHPSAGEASEMVDLRALLSRYAGGSR